MNHNSFLNHIWHLHLSWNFLYSQYMVIFFVTEGYSLDNDPGSEPMSFPCLHQLLQYYIRTTSQQFTTPLHSNQNVDVSQHCFSTSQQTTSTVSHHFATTVSPHLHTLATGTSHRSWRDTGREHVWLDSSGAIVDTIALSKPFRHETPTLKHLARLATNKNSHLLDIACLPINLQKYIEQYPFWC